MYICFTNKKKFKNDEWPSVFKEMPIPGDKIKSKEGNILYVIDIIQSQESYMSKKLSLLQNSIHYYPVISIELGFYDDVH